MDESVIKEAVNRLVEKFKPYKVILFGSQAEGRADARSDVDFLVLCDVNKNRRELALEMDRSLYGLSLPVDIVILTPDEFEIDRTIPGTIARPASLHGKVLYDSALTP